MTDVATKLSRSNAGKPAPEVSTTAEVLPFPIIKRTDFISRQAAYAASLKRESGEAHIQRQLDTQRAVMQKRGIAAALIERELRSLENAIRAALWREIFAGGVA